MGVIKNISTFPYNGAAYNFLVSVAGQKNSSQKLFFDGSVHPEYPMYNNNGTVYNASQVAYKDVIIDRDSKHWCVESISTTAVNEDFMLIEFSDGRKLKCSQKHKIKIVNPKNIAASNLSVSDCIQDVSLDSVNKKIRSTKRS